MEKVIDKITGQEIPLSNARALDDGNFISTGTYLSCQELLKKSLLTIEDIIEAQRIEKLFKLKITRLCEIIRRRCQQETIDFFKLVRELAIKENVISEERYKKDRNAITVDEQIELFDILIKNEMFKDVDMSNWVYFYPNKDYFIDVFFVKKPFYSLMKQHWGL